MELFGNSLDSIFVLKDCESRRVSSWARDGSNHDWVDIQPGDVFMAADVEGPGIVRHLWCTVGSEDPLILRHLVVRLFWDEEPEPSVEAPIGDFFGIGFGLRTEFTSVPLIAAPSEGRAMVSYFPMPFASRARFTIHNESAVPAMFYYYFDWEQYPADSIFDPSRIGYFHAQYRQSRPAQGKPGLDKSMWKDLSERAAADRPAWWPRLWDQANLDGEDNYVILEARGRGHYVGCHLNIDNFSEQANDWYGEGDDMIFIDGEPWPPRLHGTGTEDYFNTAFGPSTVFSAPFFGITRYSGDAVGRPFGGKNSMYRFHIPDPVRFRQSIRVTIEHGHANLLTNDYESTAYWYQTEPHAEFPTLPKAAERRPRV